MLRLQDALGLLRIGRGIEVHVFGEQLREKRRLIENDSVDVAIEVGRAAEPGRKRRVATEDPPVVLPVLHEDEGPVPHWAAGVERM